MYLKKAFLLALFVALSLVACSDIEDEILYREDATGVRFSPAPSRSCGRGFHIPFRRSSPAF